MLYCSTPHPVNIWTSLRSNALLVYSLLYYRLVLTTLLLYSLLYYRLVLNALLLYSLLYYRLVLTSGNLILILAFPSHQ